LNEYFVASFRCHSFNNGLQFYIEQMGVVALALSEALVQDAGEDLWIAPAIPPGWSMGTVYVRGNGRVAVEVKDGQVTRFELRAGSAHQYRIHNPWTDREVIESASSAESAIRINAPVINVDARAGEIYRFERAGDAPQSGFVHDGPAPSAPKSLGRVSIGLGGPCCAAPPLLGARSSAIRPAMRVYVRRRRVIHQRGTISQESSSDTHKRDLRELKDQLNNPRPPRNLRCPSTIISHGIDRSPAERQQFCQSELGTQPIRLEIAGTRLGGTIDTFASHHDC
jgi:hypothetical protein